MRLVAFGVGVLVVCALIVWILPMALLWALGVLLQMEFVYGLAECLAFWTLVGAYFGVRFACE